MFETADGPESIRSRPGGPKPGFLIVFSGTAPVFVALGLEGPLVLGRAGPGGAQLTDERLSRVHARITPVEAGFLVADLGSRNGTFVDGQQVTGEVRVTSPRTVRIGDTILVPCDDIGAARSPVLGGGPVVGSKLHAALAAVERAARTSETALVLGETGTGKELAAARFHAHGPNAKGPFVAVNCAAIPEGLAERLLFGAKKGAYSGATADAAGHLRAAHGGVLFLDEAGELDPQVQAKLLRVLETREVVPLGASHGEKVAVRIVMATHRDLRAAVAAGRFRADLYHRIAPPEIVLPPLRDRLDEVPFHIAEEVARASPKLVPQARLVEECLLRAWPGNVRELRKQIHYAALTAAQGTGGRVRLDHLAEGAGRATSAPPAAEASGDGQAAPPPPGPPVRRRSYVRWSMELTRADVERALADHGGNVSDAARALGMQRSQLYRELTRLGIKVKSSASDA